MNDYVPGDLEPQVAKALNSIINSKEPAVGAVRRFCNLSLIGQDVEVPDKAHRETFGQMCDSLKSLLGKGYGVEGCKSTQFQRQVTDNPEAARIWHSEVGTPSLAAKIQRWCECLSEATPMPERAIWSTRAARLFTVVANTTIDLNPDAYKAQPQTPPEARKAAKSGPNKMRLCSYVGADQITKIKAVAASNSIASAKDAAALLAAVREWIPGARGAQRIVTDFVRVIGLEDKVDTKKVAAKLREYEGKPYTFGAVTAYLQALQS